MLQNTSEVVNVTHEDEIDVLLDEITGCSDLSMDNLFEKLFTVSDDIYLNSVQFDKIIHCICDIHSKVSTKLKRYLMQKFLYGKMDFEIPLTIAFLILSKIGVGKIYYEFGKQKKEKKLPVSLQTDLLEWLYNLLRCQNFPSDRLSLLMPYLFKNLAYEYPREIIVKIIILILSNKNIIFHTNFNPIKIHKVRILKSWHIEITVDLLYRFPQDTNLRKLLMYMKSINHDIDFERYAKNSAFNLNSLGNASMVTLSTIKLPGLQNVSNGSVCITREEYSNAKGRALKRRKQEVADGFGIDDVDLTDTNNSHGKVSINEIRTIRDLVQNFNNINYLDVSSLFQDNPYISYSSRIKLLYVILCAIKQKNFPLGSGIVTRFSFYVQLTLKENSFPSYQISKFSENFKHVFGNLSVIFPNILYQYFATLDTNNTTQDTIRKSLSLVAFISPTNPKIASKVLVSFIKKFKDSIKIDILNEEDIRARIQWLILEFANLFRGWKSYITGVKIPEVTEKEIMRGLDQVLNYLLGALEEMVGHFNIEVELYFLRILNFLSSFDLIVFEKSFEAKTIVLPPMLFYNLLLSKSPIVVSDLCGYLAYCKKSSILKDHPDMQRLQNIYIMDTLNMIWRDKFLHYEQGETSICKALFLDPRFLDSIIKIDMFNFRESINPNTVGNLFHSPSFAYITSKIIKDLEDKNQAINCRHPGPISPASINDLIHDSDFKWIASSYEDVKIQILDAIRDLGFEGIPDLLYSSIKSIGNRHNQ